MIKKILSAVLALTLAAALLIGCDREEKEDGKKDDSGKAESYYVPTKMKMAQGDQEQSAEITWENNAFHVYVEADNTKTHMMCVEFDSKGNYTKEVEYNESGNESSRTEYEYDDKGNFTKMVYYYSDGSSVISTVSDWVEASQAQYMAWEAYCAKMWS